MFYFLMNLLSENPAGGPQMLGALIDGLIFGTLLYQAIKTMKANK